MNVAGDKKLYLDLSLHSHSGLADNFVVVNNDGVDPIAGGPGNFNVTGGGFDWQVFTAANSVTGLTSGGNDIAILAIPEPNALSLLAGSLSLAMGLQRFRRRRA